MTQSGARPVAMQPSIHIRQAVPADIPALRVLIDASVLNCKRKTTLRLKLTAR